MKIKLTLTALTASLIYSATVQSSESIKPPNPISSFTIATRVLGKLFTNSHYKIIGSCTWVVGSFPPKLVPIIAVEQYLPDLIVTVSNAPETNAWIEANAIFENSASRTIYQKTYQLATGFNLGFGDGSGQVDSLHMDEERTRVVDVIGSPAGFYHFPWLSHKAETKFGTPYYLSEADAVTDRTEIAEITYMATHPLLLVNHDIGSTHIWGHEIPRLMRVTQPSRFRSSVVAALHAADIVTNKNSLHVTHSTSNSCGKNCVVSNVIYDPNHDKMIWQEVYPNNRNINPGDAADLGVDDDKSGNGNYVFVIWRKYRGCIPHKGKFISALSFPHVGQPQKR